MKRNGIFLITILIVFIFWQWAFYSLKVHYSGLTEAKIQMGHLEEEIHRAAVRTEIVQYQFDLFKQQVAKILPELQPPRSPMDTGSMRRGLASVVQSPPDEFLPLAQVESSIDQLRELFDERKYKQVIRKAKNILALNPVSPSLVTVYFMLAESYYQNNELENCLSLAQQMTQLFPEHAKTGYVLLRVGLFLKEKNRLEEARNLFSLVAHAFEGEKELKAQSEKLLAATRGVE